MAKILIIDDDPGICNMLSRKIKSMGHDIEYTHLLKDGLRKTTDGHYDVIFLDVALPDGNGLTGLPEINKISPSTQVIIITGIGDHKGAELAIRNGAWDYIEKPSSLSLMVLPMVRALQYKEASMAAEPIFPLKREGIVGKSQIIKACLDQVAQVSKLDTNVLITGETGTGKELFAWAVHQNSSRADKPFVTVDCTILTETLVEGMLFGHEKGAFTSADRMREGLIEQANGGTLFLDEIGELPYSIQKSFLRVLQEHRFRPLGSKNELTSDFRLIAATNRNLDQMVARDDFRQDLLFRLRSFVIQLPPLRERLDDIEELVNHKLKINSERHRTKKIAVSPDFFENLKSYHWPGNVRELFNTIEQSLVVAANRSILFPNDLPAHIRIIHSQSHLKKKEDKQVNGEEKISVQNLSQYKLQDLREIVVADIEKQYLAELKKISEINMDKACAISGLSPSRLYSLLKKYNIKIS